MKPKIYSMQIWVRAQKPSKNQLPNQKEFQQFTKLWIVYLFSTKLCSTRTIVWSSKFISKLMHVGIWCGGRMYSWMDVGFAFVTLICWRLSRTLRRSCGSGRRSSSRPPLPLGWRPFLHPRKWTWLEANMSKVAYKFYVVHLGKMTCDILKEFGEKHWTLINCFYPKKCEDIIQLILVVF